jgi:transposase-like protein
MHRLMERVERAGVKKNMAKKPKAPERENRELRETREILCKALGYFVNAQQISPKTSSTAGSIHDRILMKRVTLRA